MTLEYTEFFDIIKANYIIENYDALKSNFRPESEERLSNINIDPLTLFKKYIEKSKKYNKETNKIIVKYNQKNEVGRYFAQHALSLQSLPREIRQTIARDYYIDIDIKNCHPSILLQYATKNNIECDTLKYFINNRDLIYKKLSKKYGIDKSVSKFQFLKILNGGNITINIDKNDKLYSFLKEFEKDTVSIQNYIYKNEEKYRILGDKKAQERKKLNKYPNNLGSTMNIMLCDIENDILQSMVSYLEDNKILKTSIVLVFDGFMLYKNDIENINIDDLLLKLEEHVENITNYKINLTIKEMNDIIEVPEDYKLIEELKQIDYKTYDEIKKEFELNNFKVLNPLDFCSIDFKGDLFFKSRKDMKETFEHINYYKLTNKGDYKEFSFFETWVKDATMRRYDSIDFLPMIEAPSNIYNTFKGFEIMKTEQTNEKLNIEDSYIFQHLKKVLCNNDNECLSYVLNILSRKVKTPHNLTRASLVFRSEQGAGKDMFFDWFGNHILGNEYYTNTEKPDSIFGKFNKLIDKKILVVINEASAKDTFTINENIKSAITSSVNFVEGKGKNPVPQKNHIQYIFLTNNDNCIKIPQDDRRFVVIECDSQYCGNVKYFENILNEIKEKKYNKCFYDYLMSLDSDKFDFDNKPKTSLYKDIQELNRPVMSLFLSTLVYEKITKIQASNLFDKFKHYIERYNYKIDINNTRFGIEIKKYKGIEKNKSISISYIIDLPVLKEFLIKKYAFEFYDNDINNDVSIIDSDDE
jgi:hypothetical protein